jgi:hypothetical protein
VIDAAAAPVQGKEPEHQNRVRDASPPGITWMAVTAAALLVLAAGKQPLSTPEPRHPPSGRASDTAKDWIPIPAGPASRRHRIAHLVAIRRPLEPAA